MEMIFGNINLHNVTLDISAGLRPQLIKSGLPQIAMAGRSNVGKSSLINSMLGRKKLARVSSEPGKTITVNYYNVDKKLYLADLPGYGFARRPKEDMRKWQQLTEAYFELNGALKRIFQLIDIRTGITVDDEAMFDYMNYYSIPYTIIATKCDKPKKSELMTLAKRIVSNPIVKPETECILYSASTDAGRDRAWQRIVSQLSE